MKKLLPLLAALALLVCGCGADTPPPETTTAPVIETTEAPAVSRPVGELEQSTGGAVRTYPLEQRGCTGLLPMGSGLLLFSGSGTTTLTLLTGDDLAVSATANLHCLISPAEASVQAGENGVGYYDEMDNAVVFLDAALQEVSRISMPQDASGFPALSPDLNTIYYCAGNQVRALDIQTGISRLVKTQNCAGQSLTGICCDGTVLSCLVTDAQNNNTTVYLSAETGQTLYTGEAVAQLSTWGSSYFAVLKAGNARELVFGLTADSQMAFEPLDPDAEVFPALACGGSALLETADSGCTFHFYDLSAGLRTASVTLPGVSAVTAVTPDPAGKILWFLCDQGQTLCRWDISASPVSDETVYTGTRYTAAAPDTEGLARMEAEARRIGDAYGVEILLWKEALRIQPGDYDFAAEHLVSVYEQGLAALETALAKFPEGFLAETAKQTTSGAIRIALVRSIAGDPLYGTLDAAEGIQYWLNGDACIALVLGGGLEQDAYHELFHVIETRVYASTVTYDDWDKLNPKGFSYDYDYAANQDRTDTQYLESASRSFIDLYSMSFPREDRARIFEYAMMADCGDYFTSATMQKKLTTLCTGIRKAYGLQKSEEIFPWEQYLNESLTPTK